MVLQQRINHLSLATEAGDAGDGAADRLAGAGPIERARARNRAFVEQNRGRFVLVHAGAVRRAGVSVILPGAPESGKSTLVAGLVRAGWEYFSDELALLNPTSGLLSPYPRPISIDRGAYGLFPELVGTHGIDAEQWHVEASELRPGSVADGGSSVVVDHIIFNRYDVDQVSTAIEPVSAGACLHRLVGTSVGLDQHGAGGFELLGDVAEAAVAHSLVSSSLTEQIAAIDELIGASGRCRHNAEP